MKIKFCSHSLPDLIKQNRYKKVFVNPAWLYIKKYYELHGQNPNVSWLSPGVLIESVESAINNIVQEQPDILGLGFYVWNVDMQYHIAKEVKTRLPNTIIVCGGPHLSVHRQTENDNQVDYFIQHPYIDHVVYGDGERPFQQIIDYHSGILTSKDSFVNIVDNDNGQRKIYPFEILSDDLYLSQSPYVSQELEMIQVRDHLVSQGIPSANQYWAIEFARGCMYNCSFCDWSQNLTKKVKRRRHDWRQDIDLFWRLNVPIRETDANFGQWPDDIKAFDYAASLRDPKRNFSFVVTNTPKLKKDAAEYILIQNALVWGVAPKISIQDPDETVLKAIDRPSVPWDDIRVMVKNIQNKVPSSVFRDIKIETILALPEQSIDSVVESYVKFHEMGLAYASWHLWNVLPNSPAADLDYQRFWGLKIKTVYELMQPELGLEQDLNHLYDQIAQGVLDIKSKFLQQSVVVQNRKMTVQDFWAVRLMKTHWNKIQHDFRITEKKSTKEIVPLLHQLKHKSLKESQNLYDLCRSSIDKYNFIVLINYDPVAKKIYRI